MWWLFEQRPRIPWEGKGGRETDEARDSYKAGETSLIFADPLVHHIVSQRVWFAAP